MFENVYFLILHLGLDVDVCMGGLTFGRMCMSIRIWICMPKHLWARRHVHRRSEDTLLKSLLSDMQSRRPPVGWPLLSVLCPLSHLQSLRWQVACSSTLTPISVLSCFSNSLIIFYFKPYTSIPTDFLKSFFITELQMKEKSEMNTKDSWKQSLQFFFSLVCSKRGSKIQRIFKSHRT